MIKFSPPKLFHCKNPFIAQDATDEVLEIKLLFEKAVAASSSVVEITDEETRVRLYSLYNQATKGDLDLATPAEFLSHNDQAKYEAWASLRGKSIKDAQCEYILLVHNLKY